MFFLIHIIMNFVQYRPPYTDDIRTQEFSSYEEAQNMAEFYRSCGTPAQVYVQWPADLCDPEL